MATNYITQLRALLGDGALTQTELARQIGVTQAALNRWVRGHAAPRQAMQLLIARLYRDRIGHPAIPPDVLKAMLGQATRFRDPAIPKRIAANQDLQDDIILEHTHHSNAIEGSTLTRKETEAVIFDRGIIPDKTLIEHLEATNHASLLRDILRGHYKGPVTENTILTFHARLMQGIREDAGRYSRHHRAVRGVDIALTHPDDIPEEMKRLISSWKNHGQSLPAAIADFHVSFELIHPFGDGNGRVGRLLMVHQCLAAGYPPVLIDNNRKAEYYELLEHAQRRDGEPFTLFICRQIEYTAQLFDRHSRPRPSK